MNYILKSKLLIILIIISVFTGCGYKESNTQIRDIGYLKFNKTTSENYKVVINDTYEIRLKKCIPTQDSIHCKDGDKNTLYEINSGKVYLKVFDAKDNLILERELYLGSNNTVEVDI